jgi:hypothetical protein
MDQGIPLGLACPQGLLQRIEHELGVHGAADAPADDVAGKHIDDEGDVHEPLPGRDIREVGDPELIRALGHELPIDPAGKARRDRASCGRLARAGRRRAPRRASAARPCSGPPRCLPAATAATPCARHTPAGWLARLAGSLRSSVRRAAPGRCAAQDCRRATRRRYADGATCKTLQIGSTQGGPGACR